VRQQDRTLYMTFSQFRPSHQILAKSLQLV